MEHINRYLDGMPSWAQGDWNDGGDIVLGTEVSIYRNIKDRKFTHLQSSDECKVNDRIITCMAPELIGTNVVNLDSVSPAEKKVLYERRMTDGCPVSYRNFSRLVFSDDERVVLTSNEEDHMKLRVTGEDDVVATCTRALNIESTMGIDCALVDGRYATSSVEMHGSGVYVRAMLHLPATHLTSASILTALELASSGLASNCLFASEGSSANMVSVGFTAPTVGSIPKLADTLQKLSAALAEIEMSRREMIKGRMADIVCRSWGLINNAKVLTQYESTYSLSYCIAGNGTALKTGIEVNKMKEAMVRTMDGHVMIGMEPEGKECPDEQRANIMKMALRGAEVCR